MRADAFRNREAILEAARQLLVEHGPDVPLDQVAQRAGVSIATFYRRFDDRTDLLRAVVAEETATTAAEVEHLVALVKTQPLPSVWRAAVHDQLMSAQSRLPPVMVVISSGLVPPDAQLLGTHKGLSDLFDRLIRTAQEHGLVRQDTTAHEVLALFVSAMHPLPQLSLPRNRELTSRMVRVILAGLSPSEEPLPGHPFRSDAQASREGAR